MMIRRQRTAAPPHPPPARTPQGPKPPTSPPGPATQRATPASRRPAAPGIFTPSRRLPRHPRLVLELHQDEDGFGDVADRGRADHDVLQGLPPLGHQGEAAFALVAQGARYRLSCRYRARCGVASSPGRARSRRALRTRNRPGTAGLSGWGFGQDELAGGGQVVGAARQHV